MGLNDPKYKPTRILTADNQLFTLININVYILGFIQS
jgi:hypothetical protein